MGYIITTLIGLISGATLAFVAYQVKLKALENQRKYQASQKRTIEIERQANKERELELLQARNDLDMRISQFRIDEGQFNTRVISYRELQGENDILKMDLFNLSVQVRKADLDCQENVKKQTTLDTRSRDLAKRYLKDNVKWISSSLNANNYVNCKRRLEEVIERCRAIGFDISAPEEEELRLELQHEYEREIRAALEREEQARIRAQIREEQIRDREIKRELERLARERQAIEVALSKALAEAHDQHSEEVQRLEAKLADAEAKSQRAISQAQLTKAGHVYVISNIGSFGDGVYKVGMTRRLEPLDRICELGDASVPFPFDVHMMISSDDAPSLENALHRELHRLRINKINPRREFFRTDIEAIVSIVKEHHGVVDYVADAEALQYRQSLTMSEEDLEYIEEVYDAEDEDLIGDEDHPAGECPTVDQPLAVGPTLSG